MASSMAHLFILLQIAASVLAVFENLEYDRMSVSTDYRDTVCSLQALDQHGSRGSSFDMDNNTCDSQPVDQANTMYKLTRREPVFEPAMEVYTDINPSFVVGSSFVYDVRTGTQPLTGSLTINIQRDSNLICYHLNFRFWENTVKFNSNQGYWGYEISLLNPLALNTGYQLEVKYTNMALELYINGSLFQAFQHRISMADCGVIHCTTDVGSCMRLQFFYPA